LIIVRQKSDESDRGAPGLEAGPEDNAAGLVPVQDALALGLPELVERAQDYARKSKSDRTWKAYRSDLQHFSAWCLARGFVPVPAEPAVLRLYLTDHAGTLAVSTLSRRLSAITEAHQAVGVPSPAKAPEVQFTWEGIRRVHGRPPKRKEAAVKDVVAAMLEPLEDRLIDHRDRAVLLFGFAAALRRSELAALLVGEVIDTADGLRLAVARSKTDQEAEGEVLGLPYGSNPPTCPVRAWRKWLAVSGITDGPAFRAVSRHGLLSAKPLEAGSIARMVKRRALAAGLPSADFAAHSLRAGFATTAARSGVPEREIMRHGRWKTQAVMRGYIRDGQLFIDNPAGKLGL
jgi:site-specific recombinase XerD